MITERETALLDHEAKRLLSMYQKDQLASLLNEVDELSKAGPLRAGVLGMAALALNAMERYEEAAQASANATRQEPQWAWLYAAAAAAEAGQGRLVQAQAAQQRAALLMPGEPDYGATLARYQRLAGAIEESARTARQALLLDDAHPGALNELGLTHLSLGKIDEALAQFRTVQTVAPREPDGYLNEGRAYFRVGNRSAMRRAVRNALRRDPGSAEAEELMAESLTGQSGMLRSMLFHLLTMGKLNLIGWLIICFIYYVFFRLVEFIWKWQPALLPYGRVLLTAALIYLAGTILIGRLVRWLFRTGWPK